MIEVRHSFIKRICFSCKHKKDLYHVKFFNNLQQSFYLSFYFRVITFVISLNTCFHKSFRALQIMHLLMTTIEIQYIMYWWNILKTYGNTFVFVAVVGLLDDVHRCDRYKAINSLIVPRSDLQIMHFAEHTHAIVKSDVCTPLYCRALFMTISDNVSYNSLRRRFVQIS